jgi:hypothetical protein
MGQKPGSNPGHFREEKNVRLLPGIKPLFIDHPARSVIFTSTMDKGKVKGIPVTGRRGP